MISEAEIAALSARTAAFIPACRPLLEELVRARYQRVVYLGSGALKGLAREAALKMLELTDGRVIAAADSPLGFRHGPKTILNGQSLVVVFLCNDPHARRYDLDLIAELTRDAVAARVITVADAPVSGRAFDLVLPPAAGAPVATGSGAVPGVRALRPSTGHAAVAGAGHLPRYPQCRRHREPRRAGCHYLPMARAPLRRYLGVDGGGSKTAFVLIDEQGEVLGCHQEGPAYYLQTGMEPMRAMLARGILATLAQAALTPAAVDFAFLGLPSYGEDSKLLATLDAAAAPTLAAGRFRCGNDAVCGWAGALAGQEGINVVAGTGSMAYGEYGGRAARAGGWGELFSDEGSGYWVAREGLQLFSRMSDGRAPRGQSVPAASGNTSAWRRTWTCVRPSTAAAVASAPTSPHCRG